MIRQWEHNHDQHQGAHLVGHGIGAPLQERRRADRQEPLSRAVVAVAGLSIDETVEVLSFWTRWVRIQKRYKRVALLLGISAATMAPRRPY